MAIWQQWFHKTEPQPLQHLLWQRHMIEQRGCFSDQELDEKYCELAVIDRRIKAVKYLQFRQHIRSAYPCRRATIMQRWQTQQD